MKIAGYCFIGLGILDFALSWMGVDITGFAESPVVFVAIGGISLYLAISKGKVADFEDSLDEGETLLKSGKVSVKEGGSKQEHGSMMLTNRRLLYSGTTKEDHKSSILKQLIRMGSETDGDVGNNDFELLLGDIASVETKFPNYIIIKDKNNKEFKLIPFGKKKWKTEILKAVSIY